MAVCVCLYVDGVSKVTVVLSMSRSGFACYLRSSVCVVSIFIKDGSSPSWAPKKRSPFKPIYVFAGKEKGWLDVGIEVMTSVFNAIPAQLTINRALIHVKDDLVVLTSDSLLLQYTVGTKIGNTDHRGAIEYSSSALLFDKRFRQHRRLVYTQKDWADKFARERESMLLVRLYD